MYVQARARALAEVAVSAALLLAASTPVPVRAQAAGPSVGGYTLVSNVRVGRTLADLTYRATLANPLPDTLAAPRAVLTSTSPAVTVVDANLAFPTAASGATVTSTDTFTIRQDRSVPFDIAALRWSVGAALGGQPAGLASAALINLPPVGVDSTQIENGAIMTRLTVRFSSTATVAQVNAMLAQLGGSIVAMTPRSRTVTIAIPRAASLDALRAAAAAAGGLAGVQYADVIIGPAFNGLPRDGISTLEDIVKAHQALIPARFPAAWNAVGKSANTNRNLGPVCQPVPLLIFDRFGNDPAGFTQEIPGFIPPSPASPGVNSHGYHVALAAAAGVGASALTSGANPFNACLEVRGIEREGLSEEQVAMAIANQPGHFIANFSWGYLDFCDTCTPVQLDITKLAPPLPRARGALTWKEITAGRWPEFLLAVSAGNYRNETPSNNYPGYGDARFNNPASIAADDDALFSFVTDGTLWDSQSPAYIAAGFPSLTASVADATQLATEVVLLQLDGVAAPNVLTVGSTSGIADAFNFPEPPSALTQSLFSKDDPDVLSVGEGIGFSDGTSFTAPHVAGLASYLWLLSPTLRALPASVTREAIFANRWTNIGPASGLIDAYAAVLSLDAVGPPTQGTAPVRNALLDVVGGPNRDGDGLFNAADLEVFMRHYFVVNGDPLTGTITETPVTPTIDHSRLDLNGDGYTGGPGPARFDLDRGGSTQFGTSVYSQVFQDIEGDSVPYLEDGVTDFQILCFYAYSPLWQGTPDERRQLLALQPKGNRCVFSVEPRTATVAVGHTQQFVAIGVPNGGAVEWTSTGGTIGLTTGLFRATSPGIFTVRATTKADPNVFAEATVTVPGVFFVQGGVDVGASVSNAAVLGAPLAPASDGQNCLLLAGGGGCFPHALADPHPTQGAVFLAQGNAQIQVTSSSSATISGTLTSTVVASTRLTGADARAAASGSVVFRVIGAPVTLSVSAGGLNLPFTRDHGGAATGASVSGPNEFRLDLIPGPGSSSMQVTDDGTYSITISASSRANPPLPALSVPTDPQSPVIPVNQTVTNSFSATISIH